MPETFPLGEGGLTVPLPLRLIINGRGQVHYNGEGQRHE